MSFAAKAGLVTGASSGIGRASARSLAAAGAFVGVADIDQEGGEETVAMIGGDGGKAIFLRCDVTKSADLERAVRAVVDAGGGLDFAHNNAGIAAESHPIDEVPEAAWDRLVGINLKGIWLAMKHELAVMRRQRRGAIVNTASICGLRAAPMTSPYNAAKHGVLGLTKEAAVDYAGIGLRVNAVCPGYVTTPMSIGATTPELWAAMAKTVPAGRAGEPEEIAEAVLWLLSDAASFVTGHSLVADGGLIQTMAGPGEAG